MHAGFIVIMCLCFYGRVQQVTYHLNNCEICNTYIFPFSRTFKKGDAFIGYHEDSVPAVVLQVCAELHEDGSDLSDVEREAWQEKVLSLILCHYFNYLFIYLNVVIFVSSLLKREN